MVLLIFPSHNAIYCPVRNLPDTLNPYPDQQSYSPPFPSPFSSKRITQITTPAKLNNNAAKKNGILLHSPPKAKPQPNILESAGPENAVPGVSSIAKTT